MPRYSQTDELFVGRVLAVTKRSRVLSAFWLLARRVPRGSSASEEACGVSAQTKREGLFFIKSSLNLRREKEVESPA